jgi:hypothetical protein
MFTLPINGGRPAAGQFWSVKEDEIKGIKGIEVTKDVNPLDEWVEGYLYKVGMQADELPEFAKIPLASLCEKLS